ncbi:hypothetical protein KLQ91_004781 [Salmonella enterica]|nr:hypothetical protein [Salmonella enterica]
MEFNVFSVGYYMCLGGNKRSISVVLLLLTLLACFIPFQKVYSNPLLLARAVLPTVLGRVIASRAMKTAANDAVYLALVKNTSSAVSKSVLSKASGVAGSGFFRSASGALTWGGVGYTAGSITADYYAGKGDYLIATSGTPVGNGKYQVTFGDNVYTIDYMPTEDNPFIVSPDSLDSNSSVVVNELSSGYRWWQNTYGNQGKPPYIVGSVSGVAHAYFNQQAQNNALTCRAPDKTSCSYKLNIVSITEGTGGAASSVKYTYQSSYVNSDGETITNTFTPIQGIAVFYNKNFNSDDEVVFADYKVATDNDGFSVMESLKDIPMDLDKLASMINNLLMDAAAQPDYEGIPVSSSNPVTSDEIKANYPNHGSLNDFDYMYPAQNSPSGDVNIEAPGYNQGSNADNNELPSFEYPDTPEPTLEEPPTANEILQPIADLFPQLSNVDIGGRNVSCPVAEFSIFDSEFRIDQQCVFIEQNRALISLICSIVWVLMAIRILLSA